MLTKCGNPLYLNENLHKSINTRLEYSQISNLLIKNVYLLLKSGKAQCHVRLPCSLYTDVFNAPTPTIIFCILLFFSVDITIRNEY